MSYYDPAGDPFACLNPRPSQRAEECKFSDDRMITTELYTENQKLCCMADIYSQLPELILTLTISYYECIIYVYMFSMYKLKGHKGHCYIIMGIGCL